MTEPTNSPKTPPDTAQRDTEPETTEKAPDSGDPYNQTNNDTFTDDPD